MKEIYFFEFGSTLFLLGELKLNLGLLRKLLEKYYQKKPKEIKMIQGASENIIEKEGWSKEESNISRGSTWSSWYAKAVINRPSWSDEPIRRETPDEARASSRAYISRYMARVLANPVPRYFWINEEPDQED